MVPGRVSEICSIGHGAVPERQFAKTFGQCNRKEAVGLPLSLFLEVSNLEIEHVSRRSLDGGQRQVDLREGWKNTL